MQQFNPYLKIIDSLREKVKKLEKENEILKSGKKIKKKPQKVKKNGEETLIESKAWKEQYKEWLKHPKWRKKAEAIKARDGYKCILCSSENHLEVHHTKYYTTNGKQTPPWGYPNKTLVTLCHDCHAMVHEGKTHPLTPSPVKPLPQ